MGRRGFALIDLVVTLAILALLCALVVPAVQESRESEYKVRCRNNLKHLGGAVHSFESVKKTLPPGYQELARNQGYRGNSVFALLLPYLDQEVLAKKWKYDDPFLNVVDPKTRAGSDKMPSATLISTFMCPSDVFKENTIFWNPKNIPVGERWWDQVSVFGYYGPTSYLGNAGTYSVWIQDKAFKNDGALIFTSAHVSVQGEAKAVGPIRMEDITDGTSNTFLFGERYHHDPHFDRMTAFIINPLHRWGAWGFVGGYRAAAHVLGSSRVPLNFQVPPGSDSQDMANQRLNAWGSGHGDGANFCFADGSVRYVSDGIPLAVLQSLSTRAGGERLPVGCAP